MGLNVQYLKTPRAEGDGLLQHDLNLIQVDCTVAVSVQSFEEVLQRLQKGVLHTSSALRI